MSADPADGVRGLLSGCGVDAVVVTPVSGGDISAAFRVQDSNGERLFVKQGQTSLIEAECRGLSVLREATHGLMVPEPISVVEGGPNQSLLVMSWLEPVQPDTVHWERLGQGLAELHRCTSDVFGLSEDNFIGRLPQANGRLSGWREFFVARRLEPQVDQARARGWWQPSWTAFHAGLVARLGDLIPDNPLPSLVHGDLWGGNAMATQGGPAIIDPAVYFGHREVDLAMTELFGGFSARFYSAYREAYPPEAGYEDRTDLYNLYHLLNHLNHFGGGYAASVDRVLRRYGG